MQTDKSAVKRAPLSLNELNKSVKCRLLLIGLEYTVIKRDTLTALTASGNSHSFKINKLTSYGLTHIGADSASISRIVSVSHRIKHLRGLVRHIHYHNSIGKSERRIVCACLRLAHRHPVAKSDSNSTVLASSRKSIIQISHHSVSIFLYDLGVASELKEHIGEIEEHAVPGRTVAPMIAPSTRRHDTGKLAAVILRLADIVEPCFP